jgi:hypothetical protein
VGKWKEVDAARQHVYLRARHGSRCDDSSVLEEKQVEKRLHITEAVRHYDYLFQVRAVVAAAAGVTDEASEVE